MIISNTYENAVTIWFIISVLLAVFGNICFLFWLRNRKIKINYMWAGTPGYLESIYFKWCRENKHPFNNAIIFSRIISFINVFIASVLFIAIANGANGVGQ